MDLIQAAPLTLDQRYSGIPSRLLDKARRAKARVYENQTKDVLETRRRPVALPQGVRKECFEEALKELGQAIGQTNIVLNDQPLMDGWYMERESNYPRWSCPMSHVKMLAYTKDLYRSQYT